MGLDPLNSSNLEQLALKGLTWAQKLVTGQSLSLVYYTTSKTENKLNDKRRIKPLNIRDPTNRQTDRHTQTDATERIIAQLHSPLVMTVIKCTHISQWR